MLLVYIYIYIYTHIFIYIHARTHTHTHTHIYIYIYIYIRKHTHIYAHTHIYMYTNTQIYTHIYIYISGDSVNFSSQPVVRGPKVSHHSCYCVILHCIAQIEKRTLHGVFFCKKSRYYIICSLVNTVDKIIFFLSKV